MRTPRHLTDERRACCPGGRRGRRLAILTAAASLCGPLLAQPVVTSVASASTRAASASRPPAADSYRLTGLDHSTYTVTLLTGDRIRLSETGSSHYSVSEIPAAGVSTPSAALTLTARGSSSGATGLVAIPVEAAALIEAGRLDRALFSLPALARLEAGRSDGAEVPLVLQFGPGSLAAAGVATAERWPGVRVTRTLAADHALAVSLDTTQAAGFWSALTGTGRPLVLARRRPGLTDGVERVWYGSSPRPPASMRTATTGTGDTVTITIEGSASQSKWCAPGLALCPNLTSLSVDAVSGSDVGSFYSANPVCVTSNPCTALRETVKVPPGTYWATGTSAFFIDGVWQNIAFENPQFRVSGATSLHFSIDQAHQIVIDTPRPSDSYSNAVEDYRILSNGTYVSDLTWNSYGAQTWWVTPAADTVTVGHLYFSSLWTLGAPPVTAQVTSPERFDLDATYPTYLPGSTMTRFSGDRPMQVVYARTGTAKDFQGVDAHGKLVLLKIKPFSGCDVYPWQLADAKQAGAAGVIFDPSDPTQTAFFGNCGVPLFPSWSGKVPANATLPWAAIPLTEANELLGLMSEGAVTVRVADGGNSPYFYNLDFFENNRIPADLTYKVANQDLDSVSTSYHTRLVSTDLAPFAPQEYFVAGQGVLLVPDGTVTEYYGPLSPSLVWLRQYCEPLAQCAFTQRLTFNVFSRSTATSEDWFAAPSSPGAVAPWTAVYRAQPGAWTGVGSWQYCAFCRQGNVFYPIYNAISGADPATGVNGGYAYRQPGQIHLYSGGQEIPPTLLSGIVTYDLPPAAAQYQLTSSVGTTDTEWTFRSAQPVVDHDPIGTLCVGTIFGNDAPCQADPLIFLRDNAFTDQANAVTAPGSHQLDISAYFEARAAPANVTSLEVWTSTNGGATWQRDAVTTTGPGRYTARYTVPALGRTSHTVSIRARAVDSAGGSIDQTMYDAYALRG